MGNSSSSAKYQKLLGSKFTRKKWKVKRKEKLKYLLLHDAKVSIKNGRTCVFNFDWISGRGMTLLQIRKKAYMSGGYEMDKNIQPKPISLHLVANELGRVSLLEPLSA